VSNEVLNFTNALRQTQWFSADDILDLQIPQLERLVRHAAAQTDGYAARLSSVFDGETFNFDRWQEIPILKRIDLQDHQHLYRAREVPPQTGAILQYATSGSTGRPIEFVKSQLMVHASHAMMERMFDWADADRDLSFFGLIPGPSNSTVSTRPIIRPSWSSIGGTGIRTQVDARNPVSLILAELAIAKPHYLHAMPNTVSGIIRESQNFDWAVNLKAVFCYSEALHNDLESLIKEKLGVPVFDNYASEEAGGTAVRCPASHHHHIASEMNYVEVVRDDGTLCKPGETGRVIVTPLYNFALPLIRYDQGDMAEVPLSPCPCGRGLPSLSKIVGRQRDMFITPAGSRVVARLPQEELSAHLAVAQWQMIQHNIHDIEFKYVPLTGNNHVDYAGLKAKLEVGLGFPFNLTLTKVDHIAKTANGKFRETICLVEPS
jgi:phenylacetate-CoA ligase